jgi:N-acetylmuramoyl-L-alanine amidase
MALQRIWIPSPNYSSRGGAKVRLIVIHSSEGAQTYQSLGNFFANPSSGVSSQVGIDNTAGVIGEYVNRSQKAWTQGNANPVSTSAELCTPSGASASWSTATWKSNANMLSNTAQWIAEEAAAFGIPIVKLSPAQAQGSSAGVCQHRDLGSWGGGHVDCGPNFPIDDVIQMALSGGAIIPPTPPTPEVLPDMIPFGCTFDMDGTQQTFYVADNGQMMHYYCPPGKAWIGEGLSSGWDKDGEIEWYKNAQNSYQVWGVLTNKKRCQIYWSGKAWVTQSLP